MKTREQIIEECESNSRVYVKNMSVGDWIYCSKCQEPTEITRRMKNARNRFCPKCAHDYVKSWAKSNPEKHKEHRKRVGSNYRTRHKEKLARDLRERRQKSPDKYQARLAVQIALQSGSMERGSCSVCGSTINLDAHHEDYSKPLDIVWLCRKHHMELHKEELQNVQ